MESSDTERDQPRRGRESRPPKSGNDGFITPQELLTLMDTIAYFVHLKMHVLEQNADFTVPSDVDRIIELARGLPMPRPDEWGSLAMGRISTKRTFCADGTEEIKRARRRAWKTEYNQELIDLVENDKTTDGSNLDGSDVEDVLAGLQAAWGIRLDSSVEPSGSHTVPTSSSWGMVAMIVVMLIVLTVFPWRQVASSQR